MNFRCGSDARFPLRTDWSAGRVKVHRKTLPCDFGSGSCAYEANSNCELIEVLRLGGPQDTPQAGRAGRTGAQS